MPHRSLFWPFFSCIKFLLHARIPIHFLSSPLLRQCASKCVANSNQVNTISSWLSMFTNHAIMEMSSPNINFQNCAFFTLYVNCAPNVRNVFWNVIISGSHVRSKDAATNSILRWKSKIALTANVQWKINDRNNITHSMQNLSHNADADGQGMGSNGVAHANSAMEMNWMLIFVYAHTLVIWCGVKRFGCILNGILCI